MQRALLFSMKPMPTHVGGELKDYLGSLGGL